MVSEHLRSANSDMDEFTPKRAERLLKAGLDAVAEGNAECARDSFKASTEARSTPESLTYWGWMEFHLGNTDFAIELCHQAIVQDPDFGNPYNDIGSYLISKGQYDAAMPWLEKAINAKRYEPRHYPHINLARIHLAKKKTAEALAELRQALNLSPHDTALQKTITELEASL